MMESNKFFTAFMYFSMIFGTKELTPTQESALWYLLALLFGACLLIIILLITYLFGRTAQR